MSVVASHVSSRVSHGSPTVSLERGAYRMKAYPSRRSPSKLRRSEVARGRYSVYEKRLGLLLILLIAATASCFGAAYYLFTTRWDRKVLQVENPSDDREPVQVIEFEPRDLANGTVNMDEKYLSYLPHSGFHNQRIALENALVLARILNRTLLMPPVRLGKGAIRYVPYERLRRFVALSGKEGLFHCARINSHMSIPLECLDYFDYTLVSWDWLVDLSSIRTQQRLVQRWDMTDVWIQRHLQISQNDTLTLKDWKAHHFRFVDLHPNKDLGTQYLESVAIARLSTAPQRLLQVGTLFGSSRLRLRDHKNAMIRKHVRQNMAFSNEVLLRVAQSIQDSLGGTYIAAHVRLADGQFETGGRKNTRLIWWKLVHHILGLSENDALGLEIKLTHDHELQPPLIPVDLAALRVPHPPTTPLLPQAHHPKCLRPLYMDPRFALLNTPLFISTDVPSPSSHPLLRLFYETFPCTFVLFDFPVALAPLNRLQSGYDGVMLRDFTLPFLDAIVAGKANQMAGTEGSTFSHFVEDVLWRQYHGWDIVQRG